MRILKCHCGKVEAEINIQSLLLLHPRDKKANILLIKILSAQNNIKETSQEKNSLKIT